MLFLLKILKMNSKIKLFLSFVSGQPNSTTRLGSIEIILIFFIIFLWLFSVLCCLKRYSLLLCFRKRDAAPFFDEYLTKIDPYPKPINKTSNNTNSFSNINEQKNDNLSLKYSSSLLNFFFCFFV